MNSGPDPLRKLTQRATSDASLADLTGELVGTFTAVSSTGSTDPVDGTRVWLFRCACGRTHFISVGRFRRYRRTDGTPRCFCRYYREMLAARPPQPRARRCSLCLSSEHAYTVCPKRKPGKSCLDCGDMTWRVVGPKCRSCGLRYADEKPVELEFRTGVSSIALCEVA